MSDQGHSQQPPFAIQNVSLPVHFQGFDERVPQFVNFAQVNNDNEMIQLVFSQVLPPPIADADSLESIKASGISGHVINRLVLTPETARKLAEAIQTVLEAVKRQEVAGDNIEP